MSEAVVEPQMTNRLFHFYAVDEPGSDHKKWLGSYAGGIDYAYTIAFALGATHKTRVKIKSLHIEHEVRYGLGGHAWRKPSGS